MWGGYAHVRAEDQLLRIPNAIGRRTPPTSIAPEGGFEHSPITSLADLWTGRFRLDFRRSSDIRATFSQVSRPGAVRT